jgi:nitrogen fixation NifU-like protein
MVGTIDNPLCGNMMTIYLKMKNDHIDDIKFQTFGCLVAIAVSSMLTDIPKRKSLEETKKISKKDATEALDGLPKNKFIVRNCWRTPYSWPFR